VLASAFKASGGGGVLASAVDVGGAGVEAGAATGSAVAVAEDTT